MPSWIELRLAVQGALRLARFNSDFLRYFDRSAQGALRSFWLALPIYPYYLLQIWPSGPQAAPLDMVTFVAGMSVAYLYLWILPPLAVAWLAPLMGRGAEVPGCIAAYNWMSLLNVAVSLPILLLQLAGVQDESLQIPYYVVVLASLVWEAFLLMRTLRLPAWQAGLATFADYVIMQRLLLPIFYILATGS
jgi:hypothetical protein